MTVQELIYLLEAQPDLNATVNLAILGENETYHEPLFAYRSVNGDVTITNEPRK